MPPGHRLHEPLVDIDQHPSHKHGNSSVCEQFNAWFELFMPLMRIPQRAEDVTPLSIVLGILQSSKTIIGNSLSHPLSS